MLPTEATIERSNEPFHVEVRGFDHVPDAERNMTLPQADVFWVGNSVNLFSFALGALAIVQGLNVWQALAACVVGSVTYVYVSYGSVIAVRAGLPVSALSRAAFGMRGNLPNVILSWIAALAFEVINTVFGVDAFMALFGLLGWVDAGASGKLIAVVLQLLLCGGIAVLGHATMVWFQRLFAVAVSAALLLVTAVILAGHGIPAATPHVALAPATAVATFITACATISSNPLSFLFNGADWVRYLPSATSGRRVFGHVFLASYLPSVALCMMGVICATLGDMSDPVAGVKPFVPAWLFVIYILAVIGGSLANTVPTYYSSGLTLQAMGLRVHRNVATMLDVVISTLLALYVLLVQDFTTALNNFVALLVLWVGPFGGVWICDGWLRRGRIDAEGIHSRAGPAGRYWGWHGFNVAGCTALVAGMFAAAMTMKSPLYEGPVSAALGGTDLSWVVGFPVSASVYALLARLNNKLHRRL